MGEFNWLFHKNNIVNIDLLIASFKSKNIFEKFCNNKLLSSLSFDAIFTFSSISFLQLAKTFNKSL